MMDNDIPIPSPAEPPIDPAWEKWRNEQVQTISSLLSNVFKIEDELRQCKTPSRLLRNPGLGKEQEVCEKLSAIRKQISEYEQMLQLSLKRIDAALQKVHPAKPLPAEKPSKFSQLKKWLKSWIES